MLRLGRSFFTIEQVQRMLVHLCGIALYKVLMGVSLYFQDIVVLSFLALNYSDYNCGLSSIFEVYYSRNNDRQGRIQVDT